MMSRWLVKERMSGLRANGRLKVVEDMFDFSAVWALFCRITFCSDLSWLGIQTV